MPLLELVSEVSNPLPDMNGDWTWTKINTFRLLVPATSEQYIAEMLTWVPAMRADWLGEAHGPYRLGALTTANYPPCSLSDVESKFGHWMEGFFGPEHPTDPEPILADVIRPVLAGAELFMQTGDFDAYYESQLTKASRIAHRDLSSRVFNDEHPTLVHAADILGWHEVIAIDRDAGTLTMLIMGAD
jgi:hypothetical protein